MLTSSIRTRFVTSIPPVELEYGRNEEDLVQEEVPLFRRTLGPTDPLCSEACRR